MEKSAGLAPQNHASIPEIQSAGQVEIGVVPVKQYRPKKHKIVLHARKLYIDILGVNEMMPGLITKARH